MSVFGKIPEVVADIKNFDTEIPLMTIESDNKINIENYKTIRLFTDEEISIDFDDFCLSIEGKGLVINDFSASAINISGKVTKISYLSRKE